MNNEVLAVVAGREITNADVEAFFGRNVAEIVDGVTKLTKIQRKAFEKP